jgi:hypothetical protein
MVAEKLDKNDVPILGETELKLMIFKTPLQSSLVTVNHKDTRDTQSLVSLLFSDN